MEKYISKSDVVAEIKRLDEFWHLSKGSGGQVFIEELLSFLDTLEVIDPYEQRIQYDSIKTGIKAHAETYSFNIKSKLFNQLTKEQQELWREEIEQACINGGEAGVELAKDLRYKENLEAKIDTWHLQEDEDIYDAVKDWSLHTFACLMKDGTIQMFSGCRAEDCEGHINVHIDGVNGDYDDVDDIVKWIEYT